MKVAVRFFARYREAAGRDHVELDLPEGGTVESAWEAVASRFPVLQPYRPFTLFALGTDYVQPTHLLRAGDELCFFPPVSGGASDDFVEVTAEPLSEERIMAAVGDPAAGGLVLFSGVVREETGGRSVKYLEYEAHAPMAAAKMREIASAVRARWPGVRALALDKARRVAARRPRAVVLGADTVVVLRGERLGKPRDAAEASAMLKRLHGRTHEVWTGIAVVCGEDQRTAAECTRVSFARMDAGEIEAYVRSGEPLDKAGAYGIQGLAGQFVRKIEGDYFNVVGLPLARLRAVLAEFEAPPY